MELPLDAQGERRLDVDKRVEQCCEFAGDLHVLARFRTARFAMAARRGRGAGGCSFTGGKLGFS
jgi:hypothetical protein